MNFVKLPKKPAPDEMTTEEWGILCAIRDAKKVAEPEQDILFSRHWMNADSGCTCAAQVDVYLLPKK